MPAPLALPLALLAPVAAAQCPPTTPPTPTVSVNDLWGTSVDLAGDWAVAGNPRRISPTWDGDSVAVYRRGAAGWALAAHLDAGDPVKSIDYGQSVALAVQVDGEDVTVLVGDPGEDLFTGSAIVHDRVNAVWSQHKLVDPAGTFSDQFGYAVALSSDGLRAVVGAPGFDTPGQVLVFDRASTGVNFALTQTLTDPFGSSASGGTSFGASVAVEGERVLVGNPLHEPTPLNIVGACFVFERVGGTWQHAGSLVDLTTFNAGTSVALSGDVAAVGAPGDSGPFPSQGNWNSVRVWRRSGGSWGLDPIVPGVSPGKDTQAGWSVDVEGDVLAWGEPFRDGQAGRVQVRRWDGLAWAPLTEHLGAAPFDQLGRDVALSGGWIAMGAPEVNNGAQVGVGGFSLSQGPGHLELARLPVGDGAELWPATSSASLASGGATAYALGTCPAQANALYLLAGSLSGDAPGIPVDGLVVPIVADAYTTFLLANPNPPHLVGSFGTLDAQGAATATFTLPAGSNPAWVGATFTHALVAFGSGPGAPLVAQASGPATLDLVP